MVRRNSKGKVILMDWNSMEWINRCIGRLIVVYGKDIKERVKEQVTGLRIYVGDNKKTIRPISRDQLKFNRVLWLFFWIIMYLGLFFKGRIYK